MGINKLIQFDLDSSGTYVVSWDEACALHAALQPIVFQVRKIPTSVDTKVCLATSCTLQLAATSTVIPYEQVPALYNALSEELGYKNVHKKRRRSYDELLADVSWCSKNPDRVKKAREYVQKRRLSAVVPKRSAPTLALAQQIHDSGSSLLFHTLSQEDRDAIISGLYSTGSYTYKELAAYLWVSISTIQKHLQQYRRCSGLPKYVRPTRSELTLAM